MLLNIQKVAVILVCMSTCLGPQPNDSLGQSRSMSHVALKVSVTGDGTSDMIVQNFGLMIQKVSEDSPKIVVSTVKTNTTAEGDVSIALLAGEYIVRSEKPLIVGEYAYEWAVELRVKLGHSATLELNDNNANRRRAEDVLKEGGITEEADLLNILGDGVVIVLGELGYGSIR